ncbi:MAG: transcriptional regulator [Oscillospiraceae bacterium]|nr:transcriptional regulator [Oscillospiraceae bacterium]
MGDTQTPEDYRNFQIDQDPYSYVLRTFCNRWKPFILHAISVDKNIRFNRFTKQLPISEKVLSENLRELEADELIIRTVYPEVPPRVEYSLTPQGREVCRMLRMLYDWGWHEMKRRRLPIDPLGEMWHGYRKPEESVMNEPYKKSR